MNDIYTYTVPLFVKMLTALDGILVKTQESLKEKGMEEGQIMEERLAPDMFPFKKQVQVACDNAKGMVARLTGTELPVHADDEQTLSDLRARIQKTLEFVQSVPESAYQEAPTRQVTLPYFPGQYMTGFDYAREYVLPNFFFHVTTAYAILRKLGIDIGKKDYMGSVPLKAL